MKQRDVKNQLGFIKPEEVVLLKKLDQEFAYSLTSNQLDGQTYVSSGLQSWLCDIL